MVKEDDDDAIMVFIQDVSVTSPHRKCFVAAIICDVFLVNLYLHSLFMVMVRSHSMDNVSVLKLEMMIKTRYFLSRL